MSTVRTEQERVEDRLDRDIQSSMDKSQSAADHIRLALVQSILEKTTVVKKFSIRSVLKRAGYGFSTFYRHWKSMPEFLLSCYHFGSGAFLAGFESQIKVFEGETPRQYFEMLALYSVVMDEKLPRSLVSSVILVHLEGRFSKVMAHTPRQVDLICDGFDLHFAEQGMEISREKCARVINMIAVYFYSMKLDQSLDVGRAEKVRLAVDLIESCVVQQNDLSSGRRSRKKSY